MILADTSVWIHHLRYGETKLAQLLLDGQIVTHPFVIGELACGKLKNRAAFLSDLSALRALKSAPDADVMRLIEQQALWGRGLGWIDLHLLASVLLSDGRLWTLDKTLAETCTRLGAAFQ